eukprot:7904668-Pyramimonas_sp.AAC.1
MSESLSGNGKGAHAISKQGNHESCSILGPEGVEPPPPAPLVGQQALARILEEWKALWHKEGSAS